MMLLKKVFILFIFILISLFSKNTLASSSFKSTYNDIYYQAGLDEKNKCKPCENKLDEVTGKNVYYQLQTGLPFSGASRCACINMSKGVGFFVESILKFLFASIGTVAVIVIVIAGFMYAFAAGNPKLIGTAKSLIKNAITGLIMTLMSGVALAVINPNLVKVNVFSSLNPELIETPCCDSNLAKNDVDGDDKKCTIKAKVYNINCKECTDNKCINKTNISKEGDKCVIRDGCSIGFFCVQIDTSADSVCVSEEKTPVQPGGKCDENSYCLPKFYNIDTKLAHRCEDGICVSSAASVVDSNAPKVLGEWQECGVNVPDKACKDGFVCSQNITDPNSENKNTAFCYEDHCKNVTTNFQVCSYTECCPKGYRCLYDFMSSTMIEAAPGKFGTGIGSSKCVSVDNYSRKPCNMNTIGQECTYSSSEKFPCFPDQAEKGHCYARCEADTLGKECLNDKSDTTNYFCEKGQDNVFKCYSKACMNIGDPCTKDGNGLECEGFLSKKCK